MLQEVGSQAVELFTSLYSYPKVHNFFRLQTNWALAPDEVGPTYVPEPSCQGSGSLKGVEVSHPTTGQHVPDHCLSGHT